MAHTYAAEVGVYVQSVTYIELFSHEAVSMYVYVHSHWMF